MLKLFVKNYVICLRYNAIGCLLLATFLFNNVNEPLGNTTLWWRCGWREWEQHEESGILYLCL